MPRGFITKDGQTLGIIQNRNSFKEYEAAGFEITPIPENHELLSNPKGWTVQNGEIVHIEPEEPPLRPILERLHPDVVLLFEVVAEALEEARNTLSIPTRDDLLSLLIKREEQRGTSRIRR